MQTFLPVSRLRKERSKQEIYLGGNEMQVFSIINLFIVSIPILIVLGLLFYLARYMKRAEIRADEKLNLERENIAYQNEQIETLNKVKERIANIEKLLNETN